MATIFHISKPLSLILLKSTGYLLRSCCLFSIFSSLSCYISISFSTIKGIQISLLSLLFLHCSRKSLFSYCGLILHITYSICSLFTNGLKSLVHSEDICIILFLQIAWEGIFSRMHQSLPFHFIILIHCIFLHCS